MSIRSKILLPMLAFLLLAGALVAVTGLRSLSAFTQIATLAERMIEADEASRGARDRFEKGEQLIVRVLAMTDLIEPKAVAAEFSSVVGDLNARIARLQASAVSERIGALSRRVEAEAAQWRGDAEVVLGIRAAREVPTIEQMTRRSLLLRQRLEEAVALAGQEAKAEIAQTGAAIAAQLWVLLGIAAAVCALGAAAAFRVAGNLSKPLAGLASEAARLAAGDVSVTLASRERSDEIGAMVAAIQVFKDNLIRTRRLEADTALARAGSEAQRQAGMREMADRFEAVVGSIIGTVSSAALRLQETAGRLSGAADGTASQTTAVAATSDKAAKTFSTVATAAEALGASVQEIGRQVQGSAELAQNAVLQAEQTGSLIHALSDAATRIGDVVSMISSIAGQTNLLALNATIEAARAGEAGRGFAVVATEVKELAGQTARATSEISSQIGAIQGTTDQAVAAIQAISARIREMSGLTNAVSSAVQQQGAATSEIVRNVAQAAAGASDVTANISGVARGAEETGVAASEVLTAASELSRQSEHLSAEMGRFLGMVRAA